ncbi:MAG: DUF6318 family protein [Mycobacteriales bacterium]|nr:DUF6318 family protein [Mycobacteriales bacterium]
MRGLVALGAVAVLLAGCSSDPVPPATLPPLTSSPTPSPTPAPTPTGINAPDAFGASAFTKHWFGLLTAALQTNDATALIQSSDTGCDTCQNFIRVIAKAKAEAKTTPDLRYKVLFAESAPPEDGKALVEVGWDVSAFKEYDSRGAVIRSEPAVTAEIGQVLLGRTGEGWVVLGFRRTGRG